MEIKPTRVRIEGHTVLVYRDPSVEGMTRDGNFHKLLRRLIIHDAETQEAIGCTVFFLGGILSGYSWESKEDTEYGKEAKRELALANLLPHIDFGFTNLKDNYNKRGSHCLIFTFGSDRDGFKDGDPSEYSIQLNDGFLKTAQRLVFPNGLERLHIEKEILQILFNALEENPQTSVLFEDILASIPLTTKTLVMHLNLLHEDKKIDLNMSPHADPPKIVSAKIKSSGIKTLEGEVESPSQSLQMVKNIFGTNIEAASHGPNSPITISVDQVGTFFQNIQREIDAHPDLKFDEKKEISKIVKEIEVEVTKTKDPKKIARLVRKLQSSANWVWQKILLNPYVSGVITELALRSLLAN